MSNITMDSQPRVNGAGLEKAVGKEVILLGAVASSEGNVLTLTASVRARAHAAYGLGAHRARARLRAVQSAAAAAAARPASPRGPADTPPSPHPPQDKQSVRVLLGPGMQLPGCKFLEVTGKVQGDKSVRMVRVGGGPSARAPPAPANVAPRAPPRGPTLTSHPNNRPLRPPQQMGVAAMGDAFDLDTYNEAITAAATFPTVF